MAVKGWTATQLARSANLSSTSITRFFKGVQSAPTAEKLARALGQPVERYLSHMDSDRPVT